MRYLHGVGKGSKWKRMKRYDYYLQKQSRYAWHPWPQHWIVSGSSFYVSYHTSYLLALVTKPSHKRIPGIGPVTKIKHMGPTSSIRESLAWELRIGPWPSKPIRAWFQERLNMKHTEGKPERQKPSSMSNQRSQGLRIADWTGRNKLTLFQWPSSSSGHSEWGDLALLHKVRWRIPWMSL